jgi:hypothetical protein
MTEHEWQDYQALLAQEAEGATSTAHCVGCWYEQNAAPFPVQDSSSLCDEHATATRQAYYGHEGERR